MNHLARLHREDSVHAWNMLKVKYRVSVKFNLFHVSFKSKYTLFQLYYSFIACFPAPIRYSAVCNWFSI